MMKQFSILVLMLVGGLKVLGQEDPRPIEVRTMAVGKIPMTRLVDAPDGGVMEGENKPANLPPKQIIIEALEGQGKKPIRTKLSVYLGIMSPYVTCLGSQRDYKVLSTRGPETLLEELSFLQATQKATLIFYNTRKLLPWKSKIIAMSDSQRDYPVGSIRVVNASPWEVAYSVNGDKIKLKPGVFKIIPPRINQGGVTYKVGVKWPNAKRWKVIQNSRGSFSKKSRWTHVVYSSPTSGKPNTAKTKVIRD